MFHIVALFLFSSILFAAVYQFWFNKNDMSYIGLYCRATVLSSEWSSENGRFRRHNYRCTVFLWQQCISSWIPVTRSSAWGRRFQTSQFFMHSWAYSVYPRPLLWRALLWWGSEAVLLCYSVAYVFVHCCDECATLCICVYGVSLYELMWWGCETVQCAFVLTVFPTERDGHSDRQI